MIRKYFKIWRQLSSCAIGTYLSNRVDAASFFLGKLIRFAFFLLFIFSIFRFTDTLAGYSQYEVVLFFLTFNLVDVFAQAFLRGVYLFKDDIQRGNFDYIISKPVNPLFYTLTRLTDFLDMVFLIPIIALIVYVVIKLLVAITLFQILSYLFFVFIGIVIALGFHIIAACINIWVPESDNVILLYREMLTIGRFPPEIFSPFVQIVFTFAIPVIIMISLPTKALLGILDAKWVAIALVYAAGFFIFSLLLWKVSLKRYSSASS